MTIVLRDVSIGETRHGGSSAPSVGPSTLLIRPKVSPLVPRDPYRAIRKPPETMLSPREIRSLAINALVVLGLVIIGIGRWVAGLPPVLDGLAYVQGQSLYLQSCVACHGADGRGVKGLGKNLVQSRFAQVYSDQDLAEFIQKGRSVSDPANTTKVAMPPNGGNTEMTDADRANVVAYLRGLADPRRVPANLPPLPDDDTVAAAKSALPTQASAAPPASIAAPTMTTDPKSGAALSIEQVGFRRADAPPSGEADLFDPVTLAHAKKVYASCIACHGKDGLGVKGAGKDLIHSEFFGKTSDADLIAFVKKGRAVDDPANTTGIAMPPKGGNPAMTDAKISDAIRYVRSLRQQFAAK